MVEAPSLYLTNIIFLLDNLVDILYTSIIHFWLKELAKRVLFPSKTAVAVQHSMELLRELTPPVSEPDFRLGRLQTTI
jgi:hypothetical protein